MAIAKKIFIGLAAIAALIGIIGFFILPVVAKPMAVDKLSAILHRPVTIGKIGVNPFALSVTIKNFRISEPAPARSPFVAFDELYVNLNGLSSIFRRALVLEEIHLTKPSIEIVRREDGSYNFSDLLSRDEKKPAKETNPFYFSLCNIAIAGASIDFWDNPHNTKHTVRDMNLAIPFISNGKPFAGTWVEPRFSATINGTHVELKGETKPFFDSRETSFKVDLNDIDIPFYLEYVPVKMNFKLKSARLDTRLKINFNIPKEGTPALKISGDVALRNLVLDDLQKNNILRLPEFKVAVASAEPLSGDIHLSRVSVKDAELTVKRDRRGELNLLKLVDQKNEEESSEEKKKPLRFAVDELQLDASALTFVDETPANRVVVHIAPLRLTAGNLSTQKGTKGEVDLFLRVEKKGEIALKGSLGIEPLAADINVGVKDLAVRTFQSYFNDKIRVNVRQGAVSTAGRFTLSRDGKEAPRLKYSGKLSVSNVSVADEAHANDFLSWKQLSFDALHAELNPLLLDIRGISLTDFFARIIVNADGTLNLKTIFGGGTGDTKAVAAKPAGKTEEKKEQAKTDNKNKNIKIGAVTFQGGTIDFTDRFIKPNYSARMLNIAGFVKGLSVVEVSRADVNLKGNLGYGSPIEITGKINPLAKDLFADIKVNFRDIELSPITPYASKYLGYPITKGKLTFAVEYLVDKRKLDAKNNILIDQLILGDKVESPDAVKAPVGLAVSLLTDRNGQINLDIPVSGSLDDPKFNVWRVIWQVIVNLVTKALTSPFALIASLTGGGEELSFVEFDYGSSTVTDANLSKITALVKALRERPQLKMDIAGYVDPENDGEALRKARFDRKLKSQKIKEITAKGQPPVPPEQVSILPEEYEKYLKLAYDAEKFAKPRTELGTQKMLPKEEMEKLMTTNIVVTEDDLRQLAARRADNLKTLILKSGEVESGRIFIVEPKSPAAEKKDAVKKSRAEFTLK